MTYLDVEVEVVIPPILNPPILNPPIFILGWITYLDVEVEVVIPPTLNPPIFIVRGIRMLLDIEVDLVMVVIPPHPFPVHEAV